jgi:hypothetical protein
MGWTLLTLGALVSATWLWSRWHIAWYWADHDDMTTGIGIGRGLIGVREFVTLSGEGWMTTASERLPVPRLFWWSGVQPSNEAGFTGPSAPLWPLALILFTFGVVSLRSAPKTRPPQPVPAAKPTLAARRLRTAVILTSITLVLSGLLYASSRYLVEVRRRGTTVRLSAGLLSIYSQESDSFRDLRWRCTAHQPDDAAFCWSAAAESADAKAVGPIPPFQSAMFPSTRRVPMVAPVTPSWDIWIAASTCGLARGNDEVDDLSFILWPLPLISGCAGGCYLWIAHRARRRALTGCCAICGYNLTGLGSAAACPECGRP